MRHIYTRLMGPSSTYNITYNSLLYNRVHMYGLPRSKCWTEKLDGPPVIVHEAPLQAGHVLLAQLLVHLRVQRRDAKLLKVVAPLEVL
jgi:hypothetical protein